MKVTSTISPLLLVSGAAATVQNLTQSTFLPFLQDHDLSMVSYVSPACKFCADIAPKFDEAASQLESEGIPLIRVDCTMQEYLCDDVPIYPTLRIYHKGVPTIYHGIRTAEAIVDTMHRNTLPIVSTLSSPADLEAFRKLDHVSVVGYFDDATQSEAKANFTLLAEKVRNKYAFATTSDPKFGKLNNVQAPAIAAFKNFDVDTSVETYNQLFTLEQMERWLDNNTSPYISEYGLDVGLSSTKLRQTYTAYLFASTLEERQRMKREIEPMASKFKGRILFVTIDPYDKSPVAPAPATFGLAADTWPALGVTDPDSRKFTFSFPEQGSFEALHSDAAEAFLQSVVDGTATKISKEDLGALEGLQSFWGDQMKAGQAKKKSKQDM